MNIELHCMLHVNTCSRIHKTEERESHYFHLIFHPYHQLFSLVLPDTSHSPAHVTHATPTNDPPLKVYVCIRIMFVSINQ